VSIPTSKKKDGGGVHEINRRNEKGRPGGGGGVTKKVRRKADSQEEVPGKEKPYMGCSEGKWDMEKQNHSCQMGGGGKMSVSFHAL